MLVLGAALAAPGSGLASPGRISVGLEPEADVATVAAQVTSTTGGTEIPGLAAVRALAISVPDVEAALSAARGVKGVAFAESVLRTARSPRAERSARGARVPVVPRGDRAFDFWSGSTSPPPFRRSSWPWSTLASTRPTRSSPDGSRRCEPSSRTVPTLIRSGTGPWSPERLRLLRQRSRDRGRRLPGKLLIARSSEERVDPAGPEAGRSGGRFDRGASVINLSLGGPRNPTIRDSTRTRNSSVQRSTMRPGTESSSWPRPETVPRSARELRELPAALPHVIGVGAINRGTTTRPASRTATRFTRSRSSGYGHRLEAPNCLHGRVLLRAGTRCVRSTPRIESAGNLILGPARLRCGGAGALRVPSLNLWPGQLTTILARAARDIESPARQPSGYGLLNVDETIRRVGAPPPRPAEAKRRHALARGDRQGDAPGPSSDAVPLRGRPGRLPHRASSRQRAAFTLRSPSPPTPTSCSGARTQGNSTALPARRASRPRRGSALGTPSSSPPRGGVVFPRGQLTRGPGGSYGLTVVKHYPS